MEKIKVIMIDDNVNLISMVEDYFEDNQKIEIVLIKLYSRRGVVWER